MLTNVEYLSKISAPPRDFTLKWISLAVIILKSNKVTRESHRYNYYNSYYYSCY